MIKKFYFCRNAKIILTILIFLVGIQFTGCNQGTKTADEAITKDGNKLVPIIIGTVAPLSGDQAQTGEDLARGVEIAVEELNSSGGLLGKHVKLIKLDDRADPKEATSCASKLIADPNVIGVIGHLNSGCSLPASVIYHRAQMPMITPVSTADELTAQGYREIFRVVLRNSDQGPAAAEFASQHLNAKRAAIVDDKTSYGKGISQAFKKKALKLGIEIVAEESFKVGEKDFSTIVTKLVAQKPDIIYAGAMYPEGALLMKQGRIRGLKATVISGDGFFAPKLMELGGDSVEGTFVSFLAPPWEETESALKFISRYKEKYNDTVKTYSPLAYDATMVLAEAIRKAGKVDRATLVKALHDKDFSWRGISGHFSFDENGDIKIKTPHFYKVDNGKFKYIPGKR
jgi:branched-chain amino acid transport system substrate-binding protein